MWTFEATSETNGDANAVWAAWQDAPHWNSWNPMIKESSLDGPFAVGTKGHVNPMKGPTAAFEVTEVRPGQGWATRAKMPGGSLGFTYELTPISSGTRIVMRAEIAGPLSFIYSKLVGGPCREGLPQAVKNLKAIAEKSPTSS